MCQMLAGAAGWKDQALLAVPPQLPQLWLRSLTSGYNTAVNQVRHVSALSVQCSMPDPTGMCTVR